MTFIDDKYTLDMQGAVWSPFALDKATEILRRHQRLCIKGLSGDRRIHGFVCENALREWSEEMLSPSTR